MSNDLSFLYENGFNQEQALEQGGGFDPIPEGWYRVKVTQLEVCATKAGNGKYIKLRLDVEGPSHAGRVIFTNINVVNSNSVAQEIGQALFARLLTSLNLSSPKDSGLIVGKVVEAFVVIEPARDGYEARNGVKKFRAAADGPVRISQPTQTHDDVPF